MQKIVILIVSLFLFSQTILWGQKEFIQTSDKSYLKLNTFENNKTNVSFSLSGFYTQEVITDKGKAVLLSADNSTPILKQGAPDLPKFSFSLIIPFETSMEVAIISSEYTEFQDVEIASSKGNLYRNINPDDVAFVYGQAYSQDKFFPGKHAVLNEPYVLRDYKGQSVQIFPFQYNPVSKVLRVYHKLEIQVRPKEEHKTLAIYKTKLQQETLKEFDNIYASRFINYMALKNTKYTPLEEHGSMLVICHGAFMNAMQPFVNWKNTIGIPTTIIDVASIGNTPAAIKSYIQAVYDTTNLSFVLLVGDAAQVVTNTINGYHSDNAYGYLSGNDSYPEVFTGRFSAENVSHVETQVERTINYELFPNSQSNIFNQAIGIASQEGPGHNNLYDHEHLRLIRDSLLNYNYDYVSEMYEGTQGGIDVAGDPTQAMVAVNVNSGVSLINYTGHGWDQGWGTSGFSNTDIGNLTNTKILPFIWSVACVNGNFVPGTCFGEAWLRATHNNQPSGAVAALMSTVNQSWNPPMSGQLEMNNILVESFSNNIKRTFGGLSMNGCMKMNDDYASYGAEMTDTWTLFGDPSLMVRTDNPQSLTVTHNSTVFIGGDNLLVLCATDGAFVCLTINNQIISTGVAMGGSALLTFSPLSIIDTIKVAVTAYNYIPYLGDVLIIPPSGPYVIHNSFTVNDAAGNNNGLADYNENMLLNVELKNVGIHNADSVWAVLSTNSQYITVNSNQNLWGNFTPAQQIFVNNAFELTVSNSVPDYYSNIMNLHISDNNSNVWQSSFILKANAPKFTAGAILFDDATGNGNGIVDPSETVGIVVPNTNIGHAGIANITASISCTSPYITINNGSHNFASFPEGASLNALFEISADAQTPLETEVTIVYTLNAGAYSITKNYPFKIGVLPEFWMKDTSVYICDAYFYDSKGVNGNYDNDESFTMTFFPLATYPQNEAHLKVEFLEFDVEENDWWGGCWDELFIYNGPSVSAPLIGSYCGNNWPPIITSTHPSGALTFRFTSDEYVDMGGWKAKLSCVVTTAVEPKDVLSDVIVFPNPSRNKVNISFSTQGKSVDLKIFNSLGVMVYKTQNDNLIKGMNTLEIDLTNYKSGIYYLELSDTLNKVFRKIIVN